MSKKADEKVEEKAVEEEPQDEAQEQGEAERGPTGPTLTPMENVPVEPQALAPAGEPQPNPSMSLDDGVEDIELPPPVVGQFVRITGGEYADRFAAYLGDVGLVPGPKEGTPPNKPEEKVIQVRTRDADNLLVDVLYSEVSSTTYSGGR